MRYGVFSFLFLLGFSFNSFGAPDRITHPLTSARSVLRNSAHPQARAQFDRGAADAAMPIDHATLYLRLAPGVEGFLADQQNPGSPDFHKWLAPEAFADRFGLSGNDLGKIADWLRSEGLTVNDVARGRHWITFSGTAGQVGSAFRTQIRHYLVNGEDHFANSSDISVPDAFAGLVSGVRGLDNFTMKPHYRGMKALDAPAYTNSAGGHRLTPGDYATIYNIAPLYASGIDGTGQKIAVIGQTDVDLADIRAFRTRFGLPQNDPQVVLYGNDPGTSAGDLVEADLDLEWAGAIAPAATVVYVNSTNVETSAQYAVDQNLAPVMTFSYGRCEQGGGETMRTIAQQANAQGITWMVSSGDGAAADCDDRIAQTPQATRGATVDYPGSIPEITSVGGTQFEEGDGDYWNATNDAHLASAKSYIPERVWNSSLDFNEIVGGGGGASLFFTKPAWQTGPGVPNDGARDVPDVSLSASANHDGYHVISSGVLYVIGGTSASSPSFAGIVALLNQSQVQKGQPAGQGNINPALYRMAQSTPDAFHDVTLGDNKTQCAQASPGCVDGLVGFAAAPGYDLASGLGSVNAFNLITKWNAGTVSSTSIEADSTNPALGDTLKLTAVVSGGGAAPTGSVTFLSSDIPLGTVALTPAGKAATASLAVTGTQIASGNGTVYALYGGDANFTPSSGKLAIALKVPAGDAVVVASVNPSPVYAVSGFWFYTLRLSEKAGVGATLTAFTIDGTSRLTLWPATKIPAGGSITTSIVSSGLTAPLDRIFHFAGITDNGTPWTQDLTVRFLPDQAPPLEPNITLSVSPDVIQQNVNADPSCQWAQQVTVQETGGFLVYLSSFTAGSTSYTSKISSLFGSNRLAPFGTLTANLCFSGVTAPVTRTYTLAGTSDDGSSLRATATASFAGPAAAPAAMSLSTGGIRFTTSDSTGSDGGTFDVRFSSGSPAWTVSVAPAGNGSKWLTVQNASGIGTGTVKLQANAAGLSNGVYSAALTVRAMDAVPQWIQIPLALVVGAAGDVTIRGVNNAASGSQVFAPGMLMAVYGDNLATATEVAGIQPLPYRLAGTSATINGVSAPLWFVSPGQINLQIPYETSAGTAVLGVNNNGKVAFSTVGIAPTGPGIFALADGSLVPSNTGKQGQTITGFVTGDGDVTPTLPSGATPPAGTRLSQYPQPRQGLTLTVGGVPAKIAFSGIVTGLIGVTQVNFTIPADAPLGVQPVVVSAGGVSSAPVKLMVLAGN